MHRTMTLAQILKRAGPDAVLMNDRRGLKFSGAKSVWEAGASDFSYIGADRKDKLELALRSKAGLTLCDYSLLKKLKARRIRSCFLGVDDPKDLFAALVSAHCSSPLPWGIDPSATVHWGARIHARTYIGPHTYVGTAEIGEGTVVLGNCYLGDGVRIGRNVKIRANCTIGPEGFSHFRNRKGKSVPFPHIGTVVIEDEVEIGSNTCIDRGGLGATRLKKGAIVGNLVYIAHNAVVGRNAWVIANTIVCGSAAVGDRAYIGPLTCIRDYTKVGNDAIVGMSSLVNRDIPAGQTWAGIPAREISELRTTRKGPAK